jgi:hypothetical protein
MLSRFVPFRIALSETKGLTVDFAKHLALLSPINNSDSSLPSEGHVPNTFQQTNLEAHEEGSWVVGLRVLPRIKGVKGTEFLLRVERSKRT